MATPFDPEKQLGRVLSYYEAKSMANDPYYSVVVAVDGACRNNGQPSARAALGVFFRRCRQWNKSEILPRADATSQRAELCAALRALQTVRDVVAHEPDYSVLKRVILKTDSNYLVSNMTQWTLRWYDNGFTTARGLPVANRDLFEQLAACILHLETTKGIEVLFWHVRREQNRDADRLANVALDAGPDASSIWDFRNELQLRRHDAEECSLILNDLRVALERVTCLDVMDVQIKAEIDRD
ncbi:hypothetical protein PG991_012176 [Apiospora marii]|uniref:ribonuclease H n=1 Tax=Apiospora marii TaxID=335849 RepID=A0ABR1R900_9PEZI